MARTKDADGMPKPVDPNAALTRLRRRVLSGGRPALEQSALRTPEDTSQRGALLGPLGRQRIEVNPDNLK